jgi:alanine-alpha-ketoisovalerate/valine-pyruvate aminotransferase
MKNLAKIALHLTAFQMLLCACATPVSETDNSGFLSDYSQLERVDDSQLQFIDGTAGDYSSFIIEPIVMAFRQAPGEQVFTDEELDELAAYYEEAVVDALSEDDGYPIVVDSAPGVARIRIGITDVEETIGVLNISIYTKITGLGLGGASFEGEIVDSVTGKQLAAAVRWGTGSRILKAGITHMGDAKIAINRWAKDLRAQVDEAHGQ